MWRDRYSPNWSAESVQFWSNPKRLFRESDKGSPEGAAVKALCSVLFWGSAMQRAQVLSLAGEVGLPLLQMGSLVVMAPANLPCSPEKQVPLLVLWICLWSITLLIPWIATPLLLSNKLAFAGKITSYHLSRLIYMLSEVGSEGGEPQQTMDPGAERAPHAHHFPGSRLGLHTPLFLRLELWLVRDLDRLCPLTGRLHPFLVKASSLVRTRLVSGECSSDIIWGMS